MFDCTTPKYDALYARWLANPGGLLDFAKYDPLQDRLLDLCGGTGAVAKEARRRGAFSVSLMDLNPRCDDPRIPQYIGSAEDTALMRKRLIMPYPRYTLVVCRQAIGYLDLDKVALTVHAALERGGRFAFNTFVKPRWKASLYRFQGQPFAELSGYLGRFVGHVQAGRAGIDFSLFRWHSHQDIQMAFLPYFKLTAYDANKTSARYVWTVV